MPRLLSDHTGSPRGAQRGAHPGQPLSPPLRRLNGRALPCVAQVGYGDITPSNNVSRLIILLTLGVTFVLLPMRFAKLNEVLNQQSMFARLRYAPGNKRHVVVTGHLTADSLASWLREFFHEDHGNPDFNVVLLNPKIPGEDVKAVIRKYTSVDANHVMYIQGSPLRGEDRERVCMSSASAAFVLANKLAEDAVEEDENTILTGLAIKQHFTGYAEANAQQHAERMELRQATATSGARLSLALSGGLPSLTSVGQRRLKRRGLGRTLTKVRGAEQKWSLDTFLNGPRAPTIAVSNVLMQLIQPHNAHALHDSPPLDMRVDSALCTSEISLSLLGLSTLYPGLTTLISNLLSSSSEDPDEMRVKVSWEDEYLHGCCRQIYRIAVAEAFDGMRFQDMADIIYSNFSVIVIALEASARPLRPLCICDRICVGGMHQP